MNRLVRSVALAGLLTTTACASYRQYVKDNWAASEAGVSREAYRDGKSRGLSVDEMKNDSAWYKKHMTYEDQSSGHKAIGGLSVSSSNVSVASLQLNPETGLWELIVEIKGEAGAYHLFDVAESGGGGRLRVETLDYEVDCFSWGCVGTQKVALPLGNKLLGEVSKFQKGQFAKITFKNQAREQEWVGISPVVAKVALSYEK